MAGVGILLPVLLLVLVVGGFYLVAKRQGLLAPEETPQESRVSALTEAVAYVGAILLIAGGSTAIGQRWDDIGDWGHVAVFAVPAAVFLGVGLVLRDVRDDAVQRLVSVLWFLTVGGVAGAVALFMNEVIDAGGDVALLTTGAAMTLSSMPLWLARRRVLPQVALLGSLIVTICGVLAVVADPEAPAVAFSLSLWALGVSWAVAGWRRLIEPMWVSVPLGVLLALLTPSFAVGEHGWMYAVGIATAVAVMAASVPLHHTVLLAIGTVATFGYVTSMLVRYFADSLGVPAALSFAGLLILGLAVVSARLMKAARPPGDGHEESSATSSTSKPSAFSR